jgi:hypothetical protein
MRIITTSIAALGLAGVMITGTPSATLAQGVYFEGPGVEVGIGRPYYGDRYHRSYNNYDRPYAYSERSYTYTRPYVEERRSYRQRRDRDWD